jgi:hypothetical protein
MTTDELKHSKQMKPLVSLGNVAVTSGALSSVPLVELFAALTRHYACDWGDVSPDDWKANDEAFDTEGRLISVYKTASGETLWIITEWDRETTTILLPNEY